MENKGNSIESYIEVFDDTIEHLAFTRRMAECEGFDMVYLDEKINELCTKWHDKYAKMSQAQLAIHGMTDIIKAGHGDDLLEDLFGMGKE